MTVEMVITTPAHRPGTTRTGLEPATPDRCPDGCARLCSAGGLAAAHRANRQFLLRRASALLGDRWLAEDAIQEVFVRAWRACATFDPDGEPIRNWLLVITRNVAIDMIRARAVRPGLLRLDPGPDVRPASARDEADAVVLRSALLDALGAVSPAHRGAVLRTVVHDRSYADVAAELGVPVGTVRSRVFYGLRGMRGALAAVDEAV